MIAVDHTGSALNANFNTRIAANFLDASLTHSNVVIFGRQVSGTWYNTDVSALLITHNPIERRLAEQYGVSSAVETEFIFSNTPAAQLSANYTSGVTVTVNDLRPKYALQVDDWISISDYDNQEYRRVAGVSSSGGVVTSFTIGEALDNNYTADECFIRYAFIINPDVERVDDYDVGVGTLKVRTGYADAAVAQYVDTFQGTINSVVQSDDETITLAAHDVIKTLIEYELSEPLEFDDRGVASPPAAEGTNSGNGIASDIRYNLNKKPDNFVTESVTFTYSLDAVEFDGEVYDTSGWNIIGSVTGGINPNDVMPDGATTVDRALPNQDTLISEIGGRTWTIDLLDVLGFAFDIDEGDSQFEAGDQFRVWTQASGSNAVVEGENYASTPITTTITALNPTYIVEYVVKTLLTLTHENPETDTSSDIFIATELAAIRTDALTSLDQDFRTILRGGRFPKGTRAIEVCDDALRVAGAYLVSTNDDHLRFIFYSSRQVPSAIPLTFSADAENTGRTWNAWDIESEPLARNTTVNRVRFKYDTQDEQKEVTAEDTTSQAAYGLRKMVIKGQDFTDYDLSSIFDVKTNVIQNAAQRLLNRYKVPLATYDFTAHPNALLLELGDIPAFYSREAGQTNLRLFIVGISKNLATRQVRVTGEIATHIAGKFAKVVEDGVDPAVGSIWDSTGFIGSIGEERLGIVADATLGLDSVGDNDGNLEPRLGIKDQWGNGVEEPYIAE